MMAEPYLIAHIVRGSPAFDIAIQLQIGDEDGWIIPTSGHRAYPYWDWPLTGLIINHKDFERIDIVELCSDPPVDWPDHYSINNHKKNIDIGQSLAEALGLIPKPKPIDRRL